GMQHYKNAQRAHDAGEYELAIREYQAAYAINPLPLLLFDIGQVYRLIGNAEQAETYYRKYLALEPNGRASPAAPPLLRRPRSARLPPRPHAAAGAPPDRGAARGPPPAPGAGPAPAAGAPPAAPGAGVPTTRARAGADARGATAVGSTIRGDPRSRSARTR